jgi:hypothetical protein
MARTPPVIGTQAPGTFITAALWNAQVGGIGGFALTPPMFKAYATATTVVPNNSTPTIALDTTVIDTEAGHSATTNPSRYTIQVPGKYVAVGSLSFPGNSDSTRRGLGIMQNGAFVRNIAYPAITNSSWSGSMSEILVCAAGDYIELAAINGASTSQSLNVGTVAVDPTLSLYWISE